MSDRIRQLETRLARLAEATGEEAIRERIELLNQLAWEFVPVDTERTRALSQEALALASRVDDARGMALANLNHASYQFNVAEYDGAISKTASALSTLEALGDRDGIGRVRLMQGFVAWSLGEFESAIESFNRAVAILRECGNMVEEGWALHALGGVYENLGDPDMAIGFHTRSFERFRSVGYQVGEARALGGLGSVFQRQGRHDVALEQHSEALKLYRESGTELGEARALNDIGLVHLTTGEFDAALDALNRALEIRRRHKTRPAEVSTLLALGRLYTKQDRFEPAMECLKRAVRLAQETNAKPKLESAHEALSVVYEMVGDFKEALQHHRLSHRIREEVLSDETNARLKNLQIHFEVEKAEKEAEIQRLRNIELAEALEKLKEAQAQVIQSEKATALGKLVAGLTHELNTPVGVISSTTDVTIRAVEMVASEIGTRSSIEEIRESPVLARALEALKTNATASAQAGRRVGKIATSLKRFMQLDQAGFQIADVHEGIEATLDLLTPQWGERVRVVKDFGDIPKIECYPGALNQAFMTLFLNAGEAIQGSGTISIHTGLEADLLRIVIADTGVGIPSEKLGDIFEIGFTRRGGKIRMHTGLANVHGIVKRHGGSIDARSEWKKGTRFEIRLPIRQPN